MTRAYEADGCSKPPSYHLGSRSPDLYCTEHASFGMDNVIHKAYAADGCCKHPVYRVLSRKSWIVHPKHVSSLLLMPYQCIVTVVAAAVQGANLSHWIVFLS